MIPNGKAYDEVSEKYTPAVSGAILSV